MTKNIIEKIEKRVSSIEINDDGTVFNLASAMQDISLKNNIVTLIFRFSDSTFAQKYDKEITQKCKNFIFEIDKDLGINIILTSHNDSIVDNSAVNENKKIFNQSKIEGVKHLIAIAAGKGGVGKSTLSTNLAVAFAKKGFSVGLVDTDIHGPSIGKMMGITDKPKFKENKIIPYEKFGVKTISISLMIDKDKAVIWRGPMVLKALNQLMTGTEWADSSKKNVPSISLSNIDLSNIDLSGKIKKVLSKKSIINDNKLDYLIVDFPPGTSDIQISMVQQYKFSTAIMITTPQDVSMLDVKKAIDLFNKVDIDIMGIVKNMSYFIPEGSSEKLYPFGKGNIEEFCENNDIPLLAELPIDSRISTQGDKGEPFAHRYEEDDITKIFDDIAGEISKRFL